MQIKAVTVNAAGLMKTMPGVSEKRNQMRAEGSIFGPECRVTISREGRNLSRQQKAETGTDSRSVRAERMLLREQDEAELVTDIREEYRKQLDDIDEQIKELNTSYTSWMEELDRDKDYKDTALGRNMAEMINELKDMKKAIAKQKNLETEEAQKKTMEARQMAMHQSALYQNEIDENNRDLVTLLKTMEEEEKARDRRENGEMETDGEASGGADSVSNAIRERMVQFMSTSASREKGVEEMLKHADESGRYYFDMAEIVTQEVLRKSADIRSALDDETNTDEQLKEIMREFRQEMEINYKDVKYCRSFGTLVSREVREAKIQHIANNSLSSMAEMKKSMMQSASDVALGEARRGSLDKAAEKLADEVERLIDERNNIEKTPEEKKKEAEESEKVQEELQAEEKGLAVL